MSIDEVIADFSLLDDWEDKYKYLIELGEGLPSFPDALKTPDNLVQGCMSQVWFVAHRAGDVYTFQADSDALIVKGLIALILMAYSGKTKQEILAVDINGLFKQLGLNNNLSPTRRNGFYSMVKRILEIVS